MSARRRELPWFPGVVLAALVLTAVFAAVLAPQSPTEGDITQKLHEEHHREGDDRQQGVLQAVLPEHDLLVQPFESGELDVI